MNGGLPLPDGGTWWRSAPSADDRRILIGADPNIELEVTDVRPAPQADSRELSLGERLRGTWRNLPSSEKTALKVGSLATGAVVVTAIVIAIAARR